MNAVRMGEFWGCASARGKYDFAGCVARWMPSKHRIKIVLSTPTAAPPVWLPQKHPEILPLDENAAARRRTRRAYCMNSDVYWEYAKKSCAMAETLGDHPEIVACRLTTAWAGTTRNTRSIMRRRDWHAWLKAKYETVDQLNERMGLRFWSQVNKHEECPCRCPRPPRTTPRSSRLALLQRQLRGVHPMQADILREITPKIPTTTTIRPYATQIDNFDLADVVDLVSLDSDAAAGHVGGERQTIDIARSLKKGGEAEGFWVMEQRPATAPGARRTRWCGRAWGGS